MPEQNPSHPREWNSSAYHRLSQPQVSWGREILAELSLRGDEILLDAGCGTGRLTAELLQALPRGRVVGVDLSQNMLSAARDHLLPQFGNRVRLIKADLLELPFSQVFDGIFSTAAFHWVPNHERLYSSLRQVLRPGGWLRAQCGGGANLARLRQRANALMAAATYATFFTDFHEPWFFDDEISAAKTLRRVGFKQVETMLEPALTILDDAQWYSEYVTVVCLRRHLDRIPDPALRTEFVAELTDMAAADDPPFSLDYWRLNLSAKAP